MNSRLAAARRKLLDRARSSPPVEPTRIPPAITEALAEQRAAALAAGTDLPRDWQALQNRIAVENMSLAGAPVAQIAAALNLSKGHVVALRAKLGVGRRR